MTGAELITLFGREEVIGESFLQPSKWFDWWVKGATETKVGKVAALPITLPYKTLKAAEQTISQVPSIAKKLSGAVPLVLVLVAGGIALYLYQSGKKGTKLFGRCR